MMDCEKSVRLLPRVGPGHFLSPFYSFIHSLSHLLFFLLFSLGRLFDRVDLIKPVSNVRRSVGMYVRQSTKVSSISMKFGM